MTDALAPETELDPFGGDAGLAGDLGADLGAGLSERVLNQDEIDSLLGFDMGGGDDAERSGIRAIINSALVSYERLPMLCLLYTSPSPRD